MLKINDINIDVTDDNLWRYERLRLVIGYLYTMDKTIVDIIESLKDENGCLKINWTIQPPQSTLAICQHIWNSPLCNEPAKNIEHSINGQKFEI